MYNLTSLSEVICELSCDTTLDINVNISDSTITLFGRESTKSESKSSGKMYPSNSGFILIELGKISDSLESISLFKESAIITILSSLFKFSSK